MNANIGLLVWLNHFVGTSVFGDFVITFFARWFQYFVVVGACIFLFLHHDTFTEPNPIARLVFRFKEVFSFFSAAILALVVVAILKEFFGVARPFIGISEVNPLFLIGGFDSFPSGHATFFAALATTISMYHRMVGRVFWISLVVIALARVVAGVHTPVDILGGVILGASIAMIFAHFGEEFRMVAKTHKNL